MRLFKDNKGREWRVEVNVTQVKRVRALAGVDLYKVGDDWVQRFAELLEDVVRLVDVIFVLVMDQAKDEQVSDEDFGRALAGDALGAATEAFAEELVDFFRDAETRGLLREVLRKGKTLKTKAVKAGREALEKVDLPRPDGGVNGSPTTQPAAAGSTPAR